jgi:Glycosyl transferase family 2
MADVATKTGSCGQKSSLTGHSIGFWAGLSIYLPVVSLDCNRRGGSPRRLERMQETDPQTLVVIPAHNEADGIGEVVGAIRRQAPGLSVLVVDDGSRDKTATVAREAGAEVLSHPVNRGYGEALRTGYQYALASGCERLIQMDADGQHDPASIATILSAMDQGAELVLGSRFLHDQSYSPPPIRRLGIVLFSMMATLFSGRKVTDATTGFQGISRSVLRFYVCGEPFPGDYPDANMIIRVARARFEVAEVPVRMFADEPGASMHSGWKPLWYIIRMCWMICLEAGRRLPQVDEETACQMIARGDVDHAP